MKEKLYTIKLTADELSMALDKVDDGDFHTSTYLKMVGKFIEAYKEAKNAKTNR